MDDVSIAARTSATSSSCDGMLSDSCLPTSLIALLYIQCLLVDEYACVVKRFVTTDQEMPHHAFPTWTILPFPALVLAIAVLPIAAPRAWERRSTQCFVVASCAFPIIIY